MNNLITVCWIIFGTYICSRNPEAFINDGSYDIVMGAVMGIAIFGVLSLMDLLSCGIRRLPALHDKFMEYLNK